MDLKLINTLSESRLFRNKKIAQAMNVNDAADLTFVHLMLLNIFNYDYEFAPLANEYASKTIAYNNFNYHRISGTDLYVTLNRLMGRDQEYEDEAEQIAIERINLRMPDLRVYLNHIAKNKLDTNVERRYLLKFERDLNIQDSLLRSSRRLVSDWDSLTHSQKALVVTRLVQFITRRARMSDLAKPLFQLQKRRSFGVDDSKDKKKAGWKKAIIPAAAIATAAILMKKSGTPGDKWDTSRLRKRKTLGSKIPPRARKS